MSIEYISIKFLFEYIAELIIQIKELKKENHRLEEKIGEYSMMVYQLECKLESKNE